MAWTAPATFSTSEVVTATKLNTHLRDNMKEVWYEKAYVEFVSDVTVTTSGTNPEATPLDIVSAGAITYEANPIVIELFAPGFLMTGNGGISLWDASTDIGRVVHNVSLGENGPLNVSRRLTPTAASHTYKFRLWTPSVATNTVRAGAGGTGVNMPGYIRVMQKGGA